MLDLLFAYIAGLLTLINPCVLPLLPVVLAGSIGQHKHGPAAMAAGLAVSFTLFGFATYAIIQSFGILQEDVSRVGALIMIGFGTVLLVPKAQAGFARMAGAAAGGGNKAIDVVEGNGLAGQVAAGALLGLVWSPCIGPTLGGAIALASQGENLWWALAIMMVFSAGSASIVLALGYGSRELIMQRRNLLMRITKYAKPVMGIALILVGLSIWFHFDRVVEAWVVQVLPAWLVDFSVSL